MYSSRPLSHFPGQCPPSGAAPFENETLAPTDGSDCPNPSKFACSIFCGLAFIGCLLQSKEKGEITNRRTPNMRTPNRLSQPSKFACSIFCGSAFIGYLLQNQGERLNHKPQNTEHANSEVGRSGDVPGQSHRQKRWPHLKETLVRDCGQSCCCPALSSEPGLISLISQVVRGSARLGLVMLAVHPFCGTLGAANATHSDGQHGRAKGGWSCRCGMKMLNSEPKP